MQKDRAYVPDNEVSRAEAHNTWAGGMRCDVMIALRMHLRLGMFKCCLASRSQHQSARARSDLHLSAFKATFQLAAASTTVRDAPIEDERVCGMRTML